MHHVLRGRYCSDVTLQETIPEDLGEARCQVQTEHEGLVR